MKYLEVCSCSSGWHRLRLIWPRPSQLGVIWVPVQNLCQDWAGHALCSKLTKSAAGSSTELLIKKPKESSTIFSSKIIDMTRVTALFSSDKLSLEGSSRFSSEGHKFHSTTKINSLRTAHIRINDYKVSESKNTHYRHLVSGLTRKCCPGNNQYAPLWRPRFMVNGHQA